MVERSFYNVSICNLSFISTVWWMVLRLYRTMQYFKVSFCSVFAITVDCFYLTKSEVEVVYKILIDIQVVHFLEQVAFVQDTTWAFCVFLPECYLKEVTLCIPGVSASLPTSTVHSSQGDFECLSLLFSLRFTKLPDVGYLRHLLSPCIIITN